MKKIAVLLLVCCLLCPLSALASNDVAVHINGTPVKFDVPAQIIDNRTMVPMRKIFETYSASVEWIERSQTIIATRGPVVIAMQIGEPIMSVSNILTGESKSITLDVPPCIITGPEGGRTLVPVRALSESLGMAVAWDEVTRTVLITG